MKKIIVAVILTVGLLGVLAPPAEANIVSDAASVVGRTTVGVAAGTVHILGSVIEPVIGFVKKTTTNIVMVAIDHPVQTAVVGGIIIATIAVPFLLSVDGEVLATATTVEVETVVTEATIETEAVAEVEVTEAEGSCYVGGCNNGSAIPKELRDPVRVLSNKDKEELLTKAECFTPAGCISATTGERFPLRDPVTGRMNAHIDHILAHSAGGATSIENSQVIPAAENLAKSGPRL